MPFLNADQIAETMPPDHQSPEREAGRLLLERWDNLAARRRAFAVETTLASRSFAPRLRRLRQDGWRVYLVFVASPDPALNLARVACRVRAGGHDIPEETIRRRFAAGRENLTGLYAPLADRHFVFCNDDLAGPELLERGGNGPAADSTFDDGDEVQRRFSVAVREVLWDHQRSGNTVAIWRDGAVRVLPPDEITVSPLCG
jgi:predicted ABC-type ATPase